MYSGMEKLREVLTHLSDEQKLHILQRKYNRYTLFVWWTPLHCAARKGHTEIISTVLTSLQSSADRLKLLMEDEYYTPLHYAALVGRTESVKVILDCLTADQQMKLMSVQRMGDMIAVQLAERGHTDAVRMLREYEHRAENLMRDEYSKLIIHNPLVSL